MIQIKEVYLRLIGIPVLALFTMYLMPHDSPAPFWAEYLINLGFTAFYWNLMIFIYRSYRKLFPEINSYGKRLLSTVFTMIIITIIANPTIRLALGLVNFEEIFAMKVLFEFVPQILLISFMVTSFYETAYFFERYKESAKNYADLQSQQLKVQFEVLQNQMSPHFLFNSLNTLSSLIQEDPKQAEDFTERLSDVYRYILLNKDREVVPLEEELEFVRAYIFLLQIRYPTNLHVTIDVEGLKDRYIPPLTLQILVENAVKHNAISARSPLQVEIYRAKGEAIVVKNNVKAKNTLEKSTRTGLENLQRRYKLLENNKIDIIQTPANFMVVVPVFDIEIEESLFEKINAQ
jgi:sensor histidine kinase YesM